MLCGATLIGMNSVGVEGFGRRLAVGWSRHRGVAVHGERGRQSRDRCGCDGGWSAGTCTHLKTKMSDVQFCAELTSTLTHSSISFPFLERDSFGLLYITRVKVCSLANGAVRLLNGTAVLSAKCHDNNVPTKTMLTC